MNVVYASNENYVRHLAVSMISLFDRNTSASEITVYVLSMGITGTSRKRLKTMAQMYKREVHIIEFSHIRECFSAAVNTRGFDISAMGRLFVGQLLPEEVKRVLYLDCDTVVVRSLERLWNTDLQGCILGAVMEPTIYESVKEQAGLGVRDAYINSGVLLIDLVRWRQFGTEKRLLDFYEEKGANLFACDQDTINGALKGEIFFLSPRYNFFSNYRYFSYKELVKYSRTYETVGEKEYKRAKAYPAIIHYAGDERPWVAGNRNHYRGAYEKYLAMTPWAGTPKEKGKELYMLAYHLMDYVTALCPGFRRMIIRRGTGMKVVEARKTGKTDFVVQSDLLTRPDFSVNTAFPIDAVYRDRIVVLLAAYEGEAYIGAQLDSILAQSISGIQIIVSDDGSQDKTRDILEGYQKAYPENIRLCHRGRNMGRDEVPAPAMNFFWLLSQADADYYLFSDQDDIWHPQKVEILLAQMKKAEKEGGPLLVYSDMEVVDEKLRRLSPSFCSYAHSNSRRLSFSEILVENPVTGGAMMINQSLKELVQTVPEACFMHDWWIALCASCFGRIIYVPQPLSKYRQHGGNLLGAEKADILHTLKCRKERQKQVEDNYRKMFRQAEAFWECYGSRMSPGQRIVLKQFLSLPAGKPWERLRLIVKGRFFKSSLLQTLAQPVTIPSVHVCGKQQEKIRKRENMNLYCVVVNFNEAETTERLIRQIEGFSCLKRIIVVDNASSDDSWEYLQSFSSEKIILLRAGKNGGYGAGNNLGIRYAEKEGATHVLIANPDVRFGEDCLNGMLQVFQDHPQVGIVAALMKDGSYGKFPNGWRLHGFAGQLLFMGPISRRLFSWLLYYPSGHFRKGKGIYVDVVHGSMLMAEVMAFRECGGYDEGIFLYQEEDVLAFRMKKAGRRTVLLPNVFYEHLHPVMEGEPSAVLIKRQRLREESVLYYMDHYLSIKPVQKTLARLWFWGIRMEILLWGKLRENRSGNGKRESAGEEKEAQL